MNPMPAVLKASFASALSLGCAPPQEMGSPPECENPGQWETTRCVLRKPDPSHPERRVAEAFAPILWFSSDERLFPSIPHALAFDEIDNNCDGAVDLEDPWEVAWGESMMDRSGNESDRVRIMINNYFALSEMAEGCSKPYAAYLAPVNP